MADFTPPEGFTQEDDPWSSLDLSEALLSGAVRRRLKRRRRQAFVPFQDRPRSQRRSETASVGWRIRNDPNGKGVFTTSVILPGSREYPLYNDQGERELNFWASFLFRSTQPLRAGVFYNATVTSVIQVAVETILEMAEEAVEANMTPEDAKRSRRTVFQKKTKHGTEMILAPEQPLESLGGLTESGAQAQWVREHWDRFTTLVAVHPKVEFVPGYENGFGLNLVTDLATVDTETIPTIVARFQQRGEIEHTDAAVDLTPHIPTIHRLLETHLWSWDGEEAKARGQEKPEPSLSVQQLYHYRSHGLRWDEPRTTRQKARRRRVTWP